MSAVIRPKALADGQHGAQDTVQLGEEGGGSTIALLAKATSSAALAIMVIKARYAMAGAVVMRRQEAVWRLVNNEIPPRRRLAVARARWNSPGKRARVCGLGQQGASKEAGALDNFGEDTMSGIDAAWASRRAWVR